MKRPKSEHCAIIDVDGTPVRVLGKGVITDRDRAVLAELAAAVQRLPVAELTPEQLAVRQRNHERIQRLRGAQ